MQALACRRAVWGALSLRRRSGNALGFVFFVHKSGAQEASLRHGLLEGGVGVGLHGDEGEAEFFRHQAHEGGGGLDRDGICLGEEGAAHGHHVVV